MFFCLYQNCELVLEDFFISSTERTVALSACRLVHSNKHRSRFCDRKIADKARMSGPEVSMLKYHYNRRSLGSFLSKSWQPLTGRAHATRLHSRAAFPGSMCCGPKYYVPKLISRSSSGTAVRTQWPEANGDVRWHVDREPIFCASSARSFEAQELWKPSVGLLFPCLIFYLFQGDTPSSPSQQITASALTPTFTFQRRGQGKNAKIY